MTDTLDNKDLMRDKLRHLMDLAKTRTQPPQSYDQAEDFDWNKPHRFNPDQLSLLENFTRKMGDKVKKTFEALCQGEFDVSITDIEEDYARAIAENLEGSQDTDYLLPFTSSDNKASGFLSVSQETAAVMVGHMLRDAQSNEGQPLTTLEESILMDINSAILDSLAEAFKDNKGPDIKRQSQLLRAKLPLDSTPMEDCVTITFLAENVNGSIEGKFTFLSSVIDPVIGAHQDENIAEDENRKNSNNLHYAPINVEAQLCSTTISLQNAMNLQPGDVLVLDKKITEPMDILFNDEPSLKAFPAQAAGRYAIVISEKEDF